MTQEEIDIANKLYDDGRMYVLHEFIKPFLKKNDPHAFYFSSSSSLPNESDEEYDKRYVASLIKAANGNVPEALYQLSALYFTGDTVELDILRGKDYLDRAMNLNFGIAKLSVGVNYYYGSNGYPKNIEKAVEIISEAAGENVEGASDALDNIKKQMSSLD